MLTEKRRKSEVKHLHVDSKVEGAGGAGVGGGGGVGGGVRGPQPDGPTEGQT